MTAMSVTRVNDHNPGKTVNPVCRPITAGLDVGSKVPAIASIRHRWRLLPMVNGKNEDDRRPEANELVTAQPDPTKYQI
jgi:hypothetical protein